MTRAELRKLLSYDPSTGVWTWRAGKWNGNVPADGVAGGLDRHGHRRISIKKKLYSTSRLAFLYMLGRWPRRTVDHINCDRADDRWENLREATQQQQIRNRRGYSSTGFKGVYAIGSGYYARITIDKKYHYLGYRKTAEEAHELYCAAAVKHYGSFMRTNHRRV